jgi:two-component system, chemotaxis family, sensor kinase Cph1
MSDARDLEICASEPIRIPGSIQPHGSMIVLDAGTLIVTQASANVGTFVGLDLRVGEGLPEELRSLRDAIERKAADADEERFQEALEIGGRTLTVLMHANAQGRLIIEFEQRGEREEQAIEALFVRLQAFSQSLLDHSMDDLTAAARQTAVFVQAITGFDRALVYRFDPEWNGHVIAQANNGELPNYLGLRFPSKDIPPQARELYRTNRLRLIPSASYEPVPLVPAVDSELNAPLDLSLAALRSVSPVHLEYMRNMGTGSSMSVSILVDGALWGLVACHSRNAHSVSANVRAAADFAVQAFSARVSAHARLEDASLRVALSALQGRLLAVMAEENELSAALARGESELLSYADATGAALAMDDEVIVFGAAPHAAEVETMVEFLESTGRQEFYTDHLGAQMPGAERFAEQASGLLAVRISELYPHWLIWFRPEVIRTVTWGGDPHMVVRESGRIHPRQSFQSWQDQERGKSTPWREAELDAARNLRNAIVGIVLRKAEVLANLSESLQRSNKELEAFSYSVSHDLRAPFRHIVGYSELLKGRSNNLDAKSRHYLDSISESALAAGRLVDDLLNFSHLGRTQLALKNVDMDKIVSEVRHSTTRLIEQRQIEWDVAALPIARGDPTLIRQVWQNLIDNAVKYTAREEVSRIAIRGWRDGDEICYQISDNGVGFDMAYLGKLFGVFQRLQRTEDFQGTGIGLALVRRIIDRHKGRVWAEGSVGEGATFGFSLPLKVRIDD